MRLQNETHYLLLVWLIVSGLIISGVVVSWNEGLIIQLLDGDRSHICLVIGLLYVTATLHCAHRVLFLSAELNHAKDIAARFTAAGRKCSIASNDRQLMLGSDNLLPRCVMSEHLLDMIEARRESLSTDSGRQQQSNLTEALAERLKGAHEIGWYVVDILLKLGLVGTIIGFILMLGSVADSETLDVNTMQKVLRQMSTGMGTALFTTLAGLIGSILLGMQYLLLDKGADELLHRIIHVTEIQMNPRLNGNQSG